MEMNEKTIIQLISVIYIVFVFIIWKCRKLQKRNKLQLESPVFLIGTLAVVIFGYLFLVSFVYRYYQVVKVNRCIWIIKSVAKSIHFAVNAMTSASLIDTSGYTGDVLRWIEEIHAWFAYALTGAVVLLAPISSAAWLISLLDTGLAYKVYLSTKQKRKYWVFYDSSPESLTFAEHLKSHLDRKSVIVFCRTDIYSASIPKHIVDRIERLDGICITLDETHIDKYIPSNSSDGNVLIMCPQNAEEIKNYITPNYQLPACCSKLVLVTSDSSNEIQNQIKGLTSQLQTQICSYNDAIVDDIKEKCNGINNGFVVASIDISDSLKSIFKEYIYYNDGETSHNIMGGIINHLKDENLIVLASSDERKTQELKKKIIELASTKNKNVRIIINENHNSDNHEKQDNMHSTNDKISIVNINDPTDAVVEKLLYSDKQ